MESEPLYHFVKGKGWVLGPEGHVFQMLDCVVSLVAKTPVVGDTYISCSRIHKDWVNDDGTMIEETWRAWLSTLRINDITWDVWEDTYTNRGSSVYFVVTRL